MESQTAERFTVSEHEQYLVAGHVRQIYNFFLNLPHNTQSLMLEIQRDEHMEYLIKGLRRLGPSFCVLDANRPWLCYWILHSIALLGESVDAELKKSAIDFLSRCQDPNGGYGGGPGQMPHLATTYAAVNALITLGGRKSLSSINRHGLYMFLRRMKNPCGGFRMHDEGEIDVRACYTAISVASVLNILDDELVQNVGNYILSCQTYEGGIAGEPGSEAHGGYTFCGLATMILINEADRLDLASLIDWVVFRQGVECGFQGRTNKLVDGCYSFWQGGSVALIQKLHSIVDERVPLSDAGDIDCTTDSPQAGVTFDSSEEEEVLDGTSSLADDTCHIRQEGSQDASVPDNLNNIGNKYAKGCAKMEPLFNSLALQQYILLCSQVRLGRQHIMITGCMLCF